MQGSAEIANEPLASARAGKEKPIGGKRVLGAQQPETLKTSPGHANSVAVALDNEGWPEVLGTIAGDDTILVITADAPTGEAVQEKLLNLVERG